MNTPPHKPTRIVLTLAGLALCMPMTGCVVNDIHTELAATNQRLVLLEAQLDTINNDRLVMLESIEQSLKSIDTSLANVDTNLGPIGESLTNVDGHLASLRKTINNIDSTIPFLSISGDDEEEQAELDAAPSIIYASRRRRVSISSLQAPSVSEGGFLPVPRAPRVSEGKTHSLNKPRV